ncbi:P-loop containing nucleoside triphosphate hydrolase protein [Aspergillus varians]
MVLTELKTNALDDLCTNEQLELLNAIDSLRSQGISHYVSLPQIIVCGDQSSGKSSVLEAISGVSFPVRSSLCTRFPTELVLRKHPKASVRVSIVAHQSRTEMERKRLNSFCEELNTFGDLPGLIENAKAVMGITTYGKAFSNDLLRVEVSGPDRPHLTIVDLPGLIHSETKLQSAADVQLVQDVVQSYMREPRSIILAVVSAKNDFANQIVLRLARDADRAGSRTLGVITKPDTLVAGSESENMFISLAKNQDVEFRLGWHVLKNMDTERGDSTLENRNKEERDFFSRGAWADMPYSLVGIDTLRSRLSGLLLRQIAVELPSLIDEIESKRQDCQRRLEKLGEPRTSVNEQRSYLLQIGQSFQSLIRAAVDGTYNEPFFEHVQAVDGYEKRLRAVIQNLNEEFAAEITQYGNYRQLRSSDKTPADLVEESLGPEGQHSVTRDEYTSHINDMLKKIRGRELPGTFNPMIVRDLFLEQCRPWEGLTTNHIMTVWEAAKEFLQLAVAHVADEATSKALLDEIVVPALEDLKRILRRKTKELLLPHQGGHPITYNHDFTKTLQKIRAERRDSELRKILTDFFNTNDLQQPCHVGRDLHPIRLLNSLLKSSEPDMNRLSSSEALDCMLSYYEVALKRFVDDIANEVVEAKLIFALSEILSPVAVFDMPAKLVTRIAGESEENQALREQLNKQVHILRTGSDTCRRFVGIRASDFRKDIRFSFQEDSSEGSLNQLKKISGSVETESITAGSTPNSLTDAFDYCTMTPERAESTEVELGGTVEEISHKPSEAPRKWSSKYKKKKSRASQAIISPP